MTFDASNSNAPTGDIVEFAWQFNDSLENFILPNQYDIPDNVNAVDFFSGYSTISVELTEDSVTDQHTSPFWGAVTITDEQENQSSTQTQEFTINLYTPNTGDVNADGYVDVLDVVAITSHILGNIELNEAELEAADVNADGFVDVLDIVETCNIILGIN